MIEREVLVGHRLGLHARVAARVVQLCRQFESEVVIRRADASSPVEADGRSILALLMLSATHGCLLTVKATGVDEEAAAAELCRYLSE